MAEAPDGTAASTLEEARARLYRPEGVGAEQRPVLVPREVSQLPHAWATRAAPGKRRPSTVRFASAFFGFALVFFMAAVAIAGYVVYFGGNAVSSDKIRVTLDGPTSIAGGDTATFELTIVNRNPVALENAVIEVAFPEGTRDAANTLEAYPRFVENLGRVESGATVTRTVRAVLFGGAGQTATLPLSLSYTVAGSNSSFTKRASHTLDIASTPLELSVGALAEVVSGKPITLTLTVRSNATTPLQHVVIRGAFPFGFTVESSSLPLVNNSVLVGTLAPGESKTITVRGVLVGQDGEDRVFRFSVGTARSAEDSNLAVTYMEQQAAVAVTAPFIATTLAVNGNTTESAVMAAETPQTITVSYQNTLSTNVSNVVVAVAISGAGVDYDSISTTRGFYRSSDRTIVFSRDTDAALGTLAPGKTGLGTFTFKTTGGRVEGSPAVTFTVSVSGTRVGQANVPETVQASMTRTVKVQTAVRMTAQTLHASGPIPNTGPVPPVSDQSTSYTVVWRVENQGSTVADAVVTATLPTYVSYTGATAGAGVFSYNESGRTVSWRPGEVARGVALQGAFQVAIIPSSSQRNAAPSLTGAAVFTGYDRFAGVSVRAEAPPTTTEPRGDPGYLSGQGAVQ